MSDQKQARRTVQAGQPSASLRFLYRTVAGRILLKALTARWISKTAGFVLDRAVSRCLIPSFIRNNNIDLSEYQPEKYRSYNACFTRKIRPECRPMDMQAQHLMSPCDAKLSVYPITEGALFTIKGGDYSVSDLLGGDEAAKDFCGGYCMIFRLTVDDYHRYHYPDDAAILRTRFIKGKLHTVQPIALERYNFYKRNCREYAILQTAHFGTVAQVEVGALMVGRIVNHKHEGSVQRGEEKGYFCFGGSTVVLLLPPDAVLPDEELLRNTEQGLETVVRCGECVGTAV